MSLLGIYFGPKLIKIVEVKGRKVCVSTQIQQTAVSSGELEEKVPAEVKAVEIVAMFKDELRRHKVDSKAAALCLSGKDLIIRTFEIPMIPKEEIESAVRFEAKKYIPFKVEDLIVAHQLKFDRSSRTHMVLFMGIKKEALDRYMSILNQLDLKIQCVEYSAFSMLRHLKLNKLSDKGVLGLLSADLSGEDEVNFTVLEDGFPLFSRDISLAEGQDLSSKPKGVEPADGLEKLKSELHVSLEYYNRKFSAKNIKKVYFVSAPEHRSALESFISEVGFSAQFVNVNKYLEKSLPYSLSFLKAYSASLSKSIGLGLKVNLLAVQEKKKSIKERAYFKEGPSLLEGLKLDFKFILLGLLACASVFGYGFYLKQPVKKEIEIIIAQRLPVPAVNPAASEKVLADQEKQYKDRLEKLDRLIRSQTYVTDILNVISHDIPGGVWLTDLRFSGKEDSLELILTGMAFMGDADKEIKLISQFFKNLKENKDFSKYFKGIHIDSLDRRKLDISSQMATSFIISCKAQDKE